MDEVPYFNTSLDFKIEGFTIKNKFSISALLSVGISSIMQNKISSQKRNKGERKVNKYARIFGQWCVL